MSGAGPSNPDKGKGKQPAGRGGSGAGSSSSSRARQPAGVSDTGSSNSGQGRRKKRAPSPSGTSNSGGVEEEIESQGAKRHRTDGGGTGGDNQMVLPIQTGHPAARLMQQGGNGGPLSGGGVKLGPGNELMPANSRPGQVPYQWTETLTNTVGAVAGRGPTSAKDVSYVGRMAHTISRLSSTRRVNFMFSPVYDEHRQSQLLYSQPGDDDEEVAILPSDQRLMLRNARGRGQGQARGRGNGSESAAVETPTRELSEEDNQKISEAILLVFSADKNIDMSRPDCDSCMKRTHQTAHCPEPSSRCDTPVDSFCESTFQRNHPLDSDPKFNGNGDPIGCRVLAEHFEMDHMVDIFIHLVLYRIHKPPLRVRGQKFGWVDVLIKFADTYCGGQMPAAIVENGGLLPYTKNDVASYKSELKRFDDIGAKQMPRGECDGKTIEEIRKMVKNGVVRSQIYSVNGYKHSSEKLDSLFLLDSDPCLDNVDGASKSVKVEDVDMKKSAKDEHASKKRPLNGMINHAAKGQQPANDTNNSPDYSDDEPLWQVKEEPHEYPLDLASVPEKIKAEGSEKDRMVTKVASSVPDKQPETLASAISSSSLRNNVTKLHSHVVQAWMKEMAHGTILDADMNAWTFQLEVFDDTIWHPWKQVEAKLEELRKVGLLTPEFTKVIDGFTTTEK